MRRLTCISVLGAGPLAAADPEGIVQNGDLFQIRRKQLEEGGSFRAVLLGTDGKYALVVGFSDGKINKIDYLS